MSKNDRVEEENEYFCPILPMTKVKLFLDINIDRKS
jgi:hypothetical protein